MKKIISFLLGIMMLLAGTAAAEESDILIISPEGAPALAVSALKENVQTIAADTIVTAFTDNAADFVIAPVNAGAKLFKAGKSSYRLAAVVTWGNLVFASQVQDFSAEMINDHDIVMFGENTINSAVALFILKEKEIKPSSVQYLAGAKNTQELLLNQNDAIVMTAEPAATAAKFAAQKDNKTVYTVSLSDLYGEITGTDGFAQAGLFVSSKSIEEKPEAVKEWLQKIQASAERCELDPEAAAKDAVELGIMPNDKVALNAIPGCHVRYVSAMDAREAVEAVANLDLSQFGGELPADGFYYEPEQ